MEVSFQIIRLENELSAVVIADESSPGATERSKVLLFKAT